MSFRSILISIASSLCLLMSSAHAGFSHDELIKLEKQVQSTVDKVMPATVALVGGRSGGQMGSGSGVIVNKDGLILTAAHVIGQAKEMTVIFPDGKRAKAEALGCDYGRDIGMVKISTAAPGKKGWPHVQIGNSDSVAVTDMFIAMGHAGGFDMNRTPPIRIGRSYTDGARKFIVSDCTLIGGDSGGPLYDLDGKVVGIHSSIGGDLTQNNHVPVSAAKREWDRLLKGERWGRGSGAPPENSSPNSAFIGIQFDMDKPAPVVAEVVKGSPAEKAGIEAGDIVLAVNDRSTAKREDLLSILQKRTPGQTVSIKLQRGDKNLVKRVKLARRGDITGERKSPPKQEPENEPEPSGFDEKKLADRILKEGKKAGGTLQMTPDSVRKLLAEYGMPADELAKLSDADVIKKISAALKNVPNSNIREEKAKPNTEPIPEDGISKEKFMRGIVEESRDRRLEVNPEVARRLLEESGMDKEKLAALSNQEALDLFIARLRQFRGDGTGQSEDKTFDALTKQFTQLLQGHRPAVAPSLPSTVSLYDGDAPEAQLAYGAIVDPRGFILSKASELDKANRLRVRMGDREVPASIEKRWKEHDLALVRIPETGGQAIQWHDGDSPDLGTFLASPGYGEDPIAIGLISVDDRSLSNKNRGYLGVGIGEHDRGILITGVSKGMPAQKAGMKKDDVVLKLNGRKPYDVASFAQNISNLGPGSIARLLILRNGKDMPLKVELGKRPGVNKSGSAKFERMNTMGGKLSDVRSGFPHIIQHDLPIRDFEAGGPLADLQGRVVGLNIARAGRIKSYAIPSTTILKLLADVDIQQLASTEFVGSRPATEPEATSTRHFERARTNLEEAERRLKNAQKALDDAKAAVAQ